MSLKYLIYYLILPILLIISFHLYEEQHTNNLTSKVLILPNKIKIKVIQNNVQEICFNINLGYQQDTVYGSGTLESMKRNILSPEFLINLNQLGARAECQIDQYHSIYKINVKNNNLQEVLYSFSNQLNQFQNKFITKESEQNQIVLTLQSIFTSNDQIKEQLQTQNNIELFRKRLFSSNIAVLTISGPQDPKIIQVWAQNNFQKLQNTLVQFKKYQFPLFNNKDQIIRVFTENIIKFSYIIIQLPKNLYSQFIMQTLGDQGHGSYFQRLKAQDLAFFLETSLLFSIDQISIYQIKISSQSFNFYSLLEELFQFTQMMIESENLQKKFIQFIQINKQQKIFHLDLIQESNQLFDSVNYDYPENYLINTLKLIKIENIFIIFEADAQKFNKLKKTFSKEVVQKALQMLEKKKKKNQEVNEFIFKFYDDMNKMIGKLPQNYSENLILDKMKYSDKIFLRSPSPYFSENNEILNFCLQESVNNQNSLPSIDFKSTQKQIQIPLMQNNEDITQIKEIINDNKNIIVSQDMSNQTLLLNQTTNINNKTEVVQNSLNQTFQIQQTQDLNDFDDQLQEQVMTLNDNWKQKLFRKVGSEQIYLHPIQNTISKYNNDLKIDDQQFQNFQEDKNYNIELFNKQLQTINNIINSVDKNNLFFDQKEIQSSKKIENNDAYTYKNQSEIIENLFRKLKNIQQIQQNDENFSNEFQRLKVLLYNLKKQQIKINEKQQNQILQTQNKDKDPHNINKIINNQLNAKINDFNKNQINLHKKQEEVVLNLTQLNQKNLDQLNHNKTQEELKQVQNLNTLLKQNQTFLNNTFNTNQTNLVQLNHNTTQEELKQVQNLNNLLKQNQTFLNNTFDANQKNLVQLNHNTTKEELKQVQNLNHVLKQNQTFINNTFDTNQKFQNQSNNSFLLQENQIIEQNKQKNNQKNNTFFNFPLRLNQSINNKTDQTINQEIYQYNLLDPDNKNQLIMNHIQEIDDMTSLVNAIKSIQQIEEEQNKISSISRNSSQNLLNPIFKLNEIKENKIKNSLSNNTKDDSLIEKNKDQLLKQNFYPQQKQNKLNCQDQFGVPCYFKQVLNDQYTNQTSLNQTQSLVINQDANKLPIHKKYILDSNYLQDLKTMLKNFNNTMIFDLITKHIKNNDKDSRLINQISEDNFLQSIFIKKPILKNETSIQIQNQTYSYEKSKIINKYENVTFDLELARKQPTSFTFIDPNKFKIDTDGITEELLEISQQQLKLHKQKKNTKPKKQRNKSQASLKIINDQKFDQFLQLNHSVKNKIFLCVDPKYKEKYPSKIFDLNNNQIWYKFDDFIISGFILQLDYGINIQVSKIFSWILKDQIKQEFYDAIIANFTIDVYNIENNIQILVTGVGQKLVQIYKQILQFIIQLEINQQELSRYLFYFNNKIDIDLNYIAHERLLQILYQQNNYYNQTQINFDITINQFEFKTFFLGNIADQEILDQMGNILINLKQKTEKEEKIRQFLLKGKSLVSRLFFQDSQNYILNFYETKQLDELQIIHLQIILKDLNDNQGSFNLFDFQNQINNQFSSQIKFVQVKNGIIVKSYHQENPHQQDYVIEQYLQKYANKLDALEESQFELKKQQLRLLFQHPQLLQERIQEQWMWLSQNNVQNVKIDEIIDNLKVKAYYDLFQHCFKRGKISVQVFGDKNQMTQEVYQDYQSYIGIDSILI